MFDAGVRGRFVSVVVMPKQQLADYNPAEMQWLVDLFFADSPSFVEEIYPKHRGHSGFISLTSVGREVFGVRPFPQPRALA